MVLEGRTFDLEGESLAKLIGLPARLDAARIKRKSAYMVILRDDGIAWKKSPAIVVSRAINEVSLWPFLKLASAEPEQILAYAKNFGVMAFDGDGAPGEAIFEPQDPNSDGWSVDRFHHWRRWARSANAIMELSIALRDSSDRIDAVKVLVDAGLVTGTEQIESRHFEWPGPPLISLARGLNTCGDIETQREALALYLTSSWLGFANLRPVIDWRASVPTVEITASGGDTHFSKLTAELVNVIASDLPIGRCTRCGALYPSKIKPRDDRPHYCEDCRPIIRRATARESARRKKQEGQAAS